LKKHQEREGARLSEEMARHASRYLTAAWRLAHPPAGSQLRREEGARQEQGRELVLERWQKLLTPEKRPKNPQLSACFEMSDQAASLSIAPDGKEVPGAVVEAALTFEAAAQSALAERDALERRHVEAVAAAPDAEKSKIAKPALDRAQADLLAALVGP